MPRLIERCLPVLVGAGAIALGALIAAALLRTPENDGAMARAALEALPDSGVGNPVTAVLLNFRAFDTLLEVALRFGSSSTIRIFMVVSSFIV